MSNEKEMIPFNITPHDLYLFHIKGLNGIGEYEQKIIKAAFRRCYLLAYRRGMDNGIKKTNEQFENVLKKLSYEEI